MDKLFNNPWFIKVISLFLALMLFTMVNMDNLSNQPGGLPKITEGTYVLENVELVPHYEEDKYVLTEIPDTVKVNLRGPQNVLTLLQVARPSYELFVDLEGREPGVHHVRVQHEGLPSELSVSIVPQFVRVTIQEKKTLSLPVEIDLVNKDQVAEGYSVTMPIVTPVNVEVTASEEMINRVALAKGYIDVSGARETIESSVPIKIYDDQGNELHLSVEPAVVDVKVPITSAFKEIPLKITREGTLPDGISLESVSVEPQEVTIYGPKDTLDTITFIEGLSIDLSEVTENTTLEVNVPKPEGVEKVDPETVKVTIEVGKENEINMSNLPISINGTSDQVRAYFIEPVNGELDITLKGTKAVLDRVRREDIYAYVDLSELSTGEHKVPIQINGPQNITFSKNITEAKIMITDQNDNVNTDTTENTENSEAIVESQKTNETVE